MPIISDLRGLPKAEESERYVLGCVLVYADTQATVFAQLSAHDFFNPDHQAIFVAMSEVFRADGGLDTALLVAKVREPSTRYYGESPAVFLLEVSQEITTSAHLEIHIRRLRSASAARALCLTVNSAARKVLGGTSASDVAGELMEELAQLQRSSELATRLVTAASIECREIEWLWPSWLAAGALTIFDGDPGCGKTQVACDLAARVSSGRPMPLVNPDSDHAEATPVNVLVLSGEDSHGTTTRPRLEATGADLDRVWLWPDELEPIRFPSGVERLAATVAANAIRLIVIDPITAYLDDSVNTNRDADVRRALRPLIALAQSTGASVLAIRHLNKDSSKAALYRGGGSIGFIAAARAAWVVARDPSRQDRFVLAMNKCNIARHPRSLSYEIESHQSTSRVRWEAESDYHAAEILTGKAGLGRKQGRAEEIIRRLLATEDRAESEVRAACREAGICESVYRAARQAVGVVSRKSAMTGGWVLSLPQPMTPLEDVGFSDTQNINAFE